MPLQKYLHRLTVENHGVERLKPFSPAKLAVRIKLQISRYEILKGEKDIIAYGGFEINHPSHKVLKLYID